MISLPALGTLLNIYPDEVAKHHEKLRKHFHHKVERIASQNHAMVAMGEPAMSPTDIEATAAVEMARDLSYYRERSRSILTNYKGGHIDASAAVVRTNEVMGELTALRKLLEDLKPNPLGDVLHGRLDERVLVQQERTYSDLAKELDIQDNFTIEFDGRVGIVLR